MGFVNQEQLFHDVLPLFNAMGDQTRQQIMMLLAEHTRLSVAELAAQTHLSRPAVSHHLKILSDAELVVQEREGTKRYYHPTFMRYVYPMKEIIALVEQHEMNEHNGGTNGK